MAATPGPAPRRRTRRPARKRTSLTWLWVLLVAGALSVLVWQLLPRGDERPAREPAEPAPAAPAAAAPTADAAVADPARHPATLPVRMLATALSTANEVQLRALLDLPSWYERDRPDEALWTTLGRAEQETYGEDLVGRLLADPEWQEFAAAEAGPLVFVQPPAGTGREGDRAEVQLRDASDPTRSWRFRTILRNGAWRIQAWEVRREPSEPEAGGDEEEAAAEQEKAGGIFVETAGGGRQLRGRVARVDLVPGTTREEEAHIQELFELARAESGLESKLAERELIAIGHKAVPILLNRLVDLPLDGSPGRVEEVAVIHGLLQDITFRRVSFPLRDVDADRPELLAQRQREAVEAWFGWWRAWGGRWDAWVEESGMPRPEPSRPGRTRR